jgi:dienelactone hydrolase
MQAIRHAPPYATRRRFLRATMAAAGCLPFVNCSNHVARTRFPGPLADFTPVTGLPLETLQIGPSTGRAVIVLHELPGLTKDDMALARALSQRGFHVYTPILFGEAEDDGVFGGYRKACSSKLFACSELSARSKILDSLAPLCEEIARRSGDAVGCIGMCLTGILPLALLQHRVRAAVLCQPTLPFSVFPSGVPKGDQKSDLGLGSDDLAAAIKSDASFMVMRYVEDGRCPPERVAELRKRFGQRVATLELMGDHHSSLANDFHPEAFEDAVDYLKIRLGVETGPRQMRVARLDPAADRPCQIGADGAWHAS